MQPQRIVRLHLLNTTASLRHSDVLPIDIFPVSFGDNFSMTAPDATAGRTTSSGEVLS